MQIVLDWLAKLLDLPTSFLTVQPDAQKGLGGGVIQGTASEATLVSLLAARVSSMKGRDVVDALRLVAYSSDQAWRPSEDFVCAAGTAWCPRRRASRRCTPDVSLRCNAIMRTSHHRVGVLPCRAAVQTVAYLRLVRPCMKAQGVGGAASGPSRLPWIVSTQQGVSAS